MMGWKVVLFPFALIYGGAVALRNWMYRKCILKSTSFTVPTIVVGNLCMGGTGKSPHTLLIAQHLSQTYRVAVLSRGYGRKSIGFREVFSDDQSEESGDEPLMIKQSLGEKVRVFVDAKRVRGMMEIAQVYPDVQVVVLDDAFQHRALKGGLNILLSRASRPFYSDYLIPVGRLREWRLGFRRSDALIFTKVSKNKSVDFEAVLKRKYPHVHLPKVFNSAFEYTDLHPLGSDNEGVELDLEAVLLVTGIAFPGELEAHLAQKYKVTSCFFNDHHAYNASDLQKIHKIFDKLADSKKGIVTTEKDAVKLRGLIHEHAPEKLKFWRVQVIAPKLNNEKELFDLIDTYVREN